MPPETNNSTAIPFQMSTTAQQGGYFSGTYTATAPGTSGAGPAGTSEAGSSGGAFGGGFAELDNPNVSRNNSIEGTNLGNDFVFKKDPFASNKGEGSLANSLTPKKYDWGSTGTINIINDYDWTASPVKRRKDIPWIRLIEYRCNESQIKRQINFYSKLTADTIVSATGGGQGSQDVLEVYREIFPKDNPTDFSYWFPYFNKTGFELSTPDWQQLDPIGESLKQIAGGASQFASSLGLKGISKGIDITAQAAELAAAGAQVALMAQYPSVGVVDRPKVFAGHAGRQVTISFPLYNTINENAWSKNRDLIYLLMSQNLFNKRDYVTGVPPVFYDVYVPGQYYCYAAAMTNINVENLGNVRMMDGESYIIPDAYQVTLTLTEMTMPSKNQFEAVVSGAAAKFVDSTTAESSTTIEQSLQTLGSGLTRGAQNVGEGLGQAFQAVRNLF